MTYDFAGKTALIVGGTKGIGYATAKALIQRGAAVTIVGRSKESGESAVQAIGASFIQADVSLMAEVRRLTQQVLASQMPLDILIHSADVIAFKRVETSEGLERTLATTYFSRFLLNALLLERMQQCADARIVHVAAPGLPGGAPKLESLTNPKLSSFTAHNMGQRLNDIYAIELADRLRGTAVTIRVLNPGMVDTDIRRNAMPRMARVIEWLSRKNTKTPDAYAQIVLGWIAHADRDPVLLGIGEKPVKLRAPEQDPRYRSELWALTERITTLSRATYPAATQTLVTP